TRWPAMSRRVRTPPPSPEPHARAAPAAPGRPPRRRARRPPRAARRQGRRPAAPTCSEARSSPQHERPSRPSFRLRRGLLRAKRPSWARFGLGARPPARRASLERLLQAAPALADLDLTPGAELPGCEPLRHLVIEPSEDGAAAGVPDKPAVARLGRPAD